MGLVIQAFRSLVEVDILDWFRFPCPHVGICHTSVGLGLMIVQELNTGNAERRKTESPPDVES